jgi:xanthine/CO dehydrogenase XdhC/CoxF family maturation factor
MSATELAWFKSSYSGTQGDSCVEIAVTEEAVHVRDSKDKDGPHLTLGRDEWARFVQFAGEHS